MAPGLAIAGHRMLNSPVDSNFPFHNIQHLKRLNLDAKFQFHYQDSHQNCPIFDMLKQKQITAFSVLIQAGTGTSCCGVKVEVCELLK